MSKTFASLFSGFGLADIGAKMAGCELAWGVELDPAIAEVSRQQGHQVLVQSVTEVDWKKLEKPDILWASPPCPNFSIAKAGAKETPFDRAMAEAVVEAIKTFQPECFILENVEGYKRSKSLEFIEGALFALGYWVDRQILNAADFGVPQTRRRLILRAVRGGFVPALPQPQQWIGWYEAVEDLIPGLPETKLADWQMKRLPEPLVSLLFQAGNPNGNRIEKFRRTDYPAPTVCASEGLARAVLVSGTPDTYGQEISILESKSPALSVTKSTGDRQPMRAVLVSSQRDATLRNGSEPSTTIVSIGDGHSVLPKALMMNRSQTERGDYFREGDRPSYTVCAEGTAGRVRALLDNAKVVQISPRCLARFQTLPDWYELPDKSTLACKGIGNGVPCKLSEAIVRSLIS